MGFQGVGNVRFIAVFSISSIIRSDKRIRGQYPAWFKRGWHALRYSEGRGVFASGPRPSEYLRACHPKASVFEPCPIPAAGGGARFLGAWLSIWGRIFQAGFFESPQS